MGSALMLGFRAHRCRWEVWKRQEPEDSETHFRKAVGSSGGQGRKEGQLPAIFISPHHLSNRILSACFY